MRGIFIEGEKRANRNRLTPAYAGNIVVFKPFFGTPTVIYIKLGGTNLPLFF